MAVVLESALASGSTFRGVTGVDAIRNGAFPTTDAMIVVGSFSDRTAQGFAPVLSGHPAEGLSVLRTQRRDTTPSAPEQCSAALLTA